MKPDVAIAIAGTSDLPYIGVWAADAAACGTVDQAGNTGNFAVISPVSIRVGTDLAIINAAALVDGKVALPSGDRKFEVAMPTADTVTVNGGAALVRCTP